MYFCEDFRESYAFRSTFFIGCRELHIFPYANFWREIAFSMCSVPCEAFAYRFYFWHDHKDQEALNLQYINKTF